jgi:hypothetical protein
MRSETSYLRIYSLNAFLPSWVEAYRQESIRLKQGVSIPYSGKSTYMVVNGTKFEHLYFQCINLSKIKKNRAA